jgi:hypothetical protein
MNILTSFSIFVFLWLPMALVGLPVVYLLLLTSWDGKTTWFGNYLYGRQGNINTPANPSLFDQWNFLAIRNPVSNFGKFTLSAGPDSKVWLEQKKIIGRLHILYGWKNPDPRLPGSRRPFVFRPRII